MSVAVPTLTELRALALAWWQEPGVPILNVLAARVASAFTDAGAIVRVRIENQAGVYTLVVDLERLGVIVTRTWTPTNGLRQETLADIYCASLGGSLKSTGAA